MFGDQLRERREAAKLSIRAAAIEAGFSEATWRHYEKGERQVTKDVAVPVAPSAKNVRAAARVVGWDLADALEAAGLRKEAQAEREAPRGRGLSVVTQIVEPVPDVEEDNEVLTAIRRDPDLDDTAREHFLNQYLILRDFSRFRRDKGELLPYVAHGERVDPPDPAEERRLEELARQAARDNPDFPYRDK